MKKSNNNLLVCIAERLTPKMKYALKFRIKENKQQEIIDACRAQDADFDIIPITPQNIARIAVLLGQVKSIKG